MSKTAYLFPGQGSQVVGMGANLCAHSPAALAVFDEADALLDSKISTLCFYGPEDALRLTVNTQPALFVASVAALRALEEAGAVAPDYVAGHSVGEYAALVAAGAVDLETGLQLVTRRAQEMHRAAETHPGAMAAVLGLSAEEVIAACAEAENTGAGVVRPANFNGGGQVVISGSAAGVAAAGEIAKQKGAKRVLPLAVSGGFHSPLMADAARAISHVLEDATILDARLPVAANVTADYEHSAAEIKQNLSAQIDGPVRWEETINRLVADGVDQFVEVGPGTVLAGLLKRFAPGAAIYSAGDSAGIAVFVSSVSSAGGAVSA